MRNIEKYYQNLEGNICSLSDAYAVIERYRTINGFDVDNEICKKQCILFFRGQSNIDWEIEPSINRSSVNEQILLSNLKYDKKESLFSIISYIQHYYTGTRFIDFTVNPEVALYFACSDNLEIDGALYIWCYVPDEPSWYRTIALMELLRLDGDKAISVQSFSERLLLNNPDWQNRFETIQELSLSLMSFLDHGFMVMPEKSNYEKNLRLERQSGCFYVCGVEFVDDINTRKRWRSNAGNNLFYPHKVIVPEDMKRNGRFFWKITIPKEYKRKIIQELQEKGITKEYLFPL